jgi:hypothetical protein
MGESNHCGDGCTYSSSQIHPDRVAQPCIQVSFGDIADPRLDVGVQSYGNGECDLTSVDRGAWKHQLENALYLE